MNRFWLQSSATISERGRGNAVRGLKRAQLKRMLCGAAEQCQEAACLRGSHAATHSGLWSVSGQDGAAQGQLL